MNKEKFIIGNAMIILGTMLFLVTTPKEGFEIIHYVTNIIMLLVGIYLSHNAIYGNL